MTEYITEWYWDERRNAPNQAQREEIVRCRDCVWFTNSSHYGAYCTNFGSPLGDDYDGFCAWAERRDT